MNVYVQYSLKTIKNSKMFLRDNSYWYKYLNRSSYYLKEFKEDMKEKYKLTPMDKLDRFSKNLNKVSEIIDIFS